MATVDHSLGSVAHGLMLKVSNNQKFSYAKVSRKCEQKLTSASDDTNVERVGAKSIPFARFTFQTTTGNTSGGIFVPFNTPTISNFNPPATTTKLPPITYDTSSSFFKLATGYKYELSVSATATITSPSDAEFSIGLIGSSLEFIGNSSTKLPTSGTVTLSDINAQISPTDLPGFVAVGIQLSKGNSFTGNSFTGGFTLENISCTIQITQ